jgi:hypothetical protein
MFGITISVQWKERQPHQSSSMAYETEIWIPHINLVKTDNISVPLQRCGEVLCASWLQTHCQIVNHIRYESIASDPIHSLGCHIHRLLPCLIGIDANIHPQLQQHSHQCRICCWTMLQLRQYGIFIITKMWVVEAKACIPASGKYILTERESNSYFGESWWDLANLVEILMNLCWKFMRWSGRNLATMKYVMLFW